MRLLCAKYDGEYIAENKGNYGMYLTKCVYEDTYSDAEYVKPEYVSDKQLWERRWDWVK